jgi:uncharacterized protein YndB with AHSA1/START domain
MIERQVTLPAGTDDVWEALVDSEILRDWFDGEVEWNLVAGGDLRITETNGTHRSGVITKVTEGNELQFEWWPEGHEEGASEVTYTLESTDDGETLLTVTERRLDAQMCVTNESWDTIDDVLFAMWVRTAIPTIVA